MKDVQKALVKIEERKTAAEEAYEGIVRDLSRDENFESSYRRLSYLNFEIARREVFSEDATELLSERQTLKDLVDEAFLKKGALGYGKPRYYCEKCKDTGYADGKKCDCLERERIEVDLTDNPTLRDLPDEMKGIDAAFYGEREKEYLLFIKSIRKNFVKGEQNFVTLIGKAGTGKTYIAATAVKELLYAGKMVSVVNAVKLNKIFLEYHCAYLSEKSGVWAQLIEPDVLLIDDLGAESLLNNVTEQYLYELLVERMDKKTIVTTNLSLESIATRYNQRIMSRLSDKRRSLVLELVGTDLRIG